MVKIKRNFVRITKNNQRKRRNLKKNVASIGMRRKRTENATDEWKRTVPDVMKALLLQHTMETDERRLSIAEMTERRTKTAFKVNGVPLFVNPKAKALQSFMVEEYNDASSDEWQEDSFEQELNEKTRNEIIPDKIVLKKQVCGNYKLCAVPQGAIMFLGSKSKVFLHGILKMEVIHGEVSVLGKRFDHTSKKVMIYSPKGSVLLFIENSNESNDNNIKIDLQQTLVNRGLDETITNDILKTYVKCHTAILYFENKIDKCTEFIETNTISKIYPKMQNNLRCTFRNTISLNWNVVQISPQWTQLINLLQSSNIIMLCGGKGVGKSTLLRYLINQQLNAKDEVYVLDLDPGQPEFTASGQISLVKVIAPLLGPSYTHLQTPLFSYFIQNIKVIQNYEGYLNSVKLLMKHVRELHPDAPLLVNCMGITTEIGLLIMACVMALVQPDVVVQIASSRDCRNFKENLTPQTMSKVLLLNAKADVPDECVGNSIKAYQWLSIDSMASDSCLFWEFAPQQLRELRILAYLSQMLPSNCSFLTKKDVKIYRVNLNNISLIFNTKPCNPMAANANVVALCAKDSETCYGWGVVRGICKQRNILLLLTPVGDDILERVHHLMVGSTTLPHLIFSKQHHAIRGHVPYTTSGHMGQFSKSPRRFIPQKNAK